MEAWWWWCLAKRNGWTLNSVWSTSLRVIRSRCSEGSSARGTTCLRRTSHVRATLRIDVARLGTERQSHDELWAIGLAANYYGDMSFAENAFYGIFSTSICSGYGLAASFAFGPWGTFGLAAACSFGLLA